MDDDNPKRRLAGGLFGQVLTYAGCVEEQLRQALYLHTLIWLTGANKVKIEQAIANGDTTYLDRMKQFLSSIILEHCPGVLFNLNRESYKDSFSETQRNNFCTNLETTPMRTACVNDCAFTGTCRDG